jgi:hypothetical protein
MGGLRERLTLSIEGAARRVNARAASAAGSARDGVRRIRGGM